MNPEVGFSEQAVAQPKRPSLQSPARSTKMRSTNAPEYPVWTDEELDRERKIAIDRFIDFRMKEGDAVYRALFQRHLDHVKRLMTETAELHDLVSGAALAADPVLLRAARFLCAPPLSEDNLNTLASQSVAKRKRLTASEGRAAAAIVYSMLDRERFPWLFDVVRRMPTASEYELAVRWTAGVWTDQAVGTQWRKRLALEQQDAVRVSLALLGLTEVPLRPILARMGLQPGEFSQEAKVANEKCDVPVALYDGRYLFLECKVSNSSVNSVKRLIRETAGKREAWRTEFGNRAIIGAVVAGVFALTNLKDAQRRGLSIIWSHDLTALEAFVKEAVS